MGFKKLFQFLGKLEYYINESVGILIEICFFFFCENVKIFPLLMSPLFSWVNKCYTPLHHFSGDFLRKRDRYM